MNIKSYSELVLLPTFEDRFEYLRLDGIVGETTFWLRPLYEPGLLQVAGMEEDPRHGDCKRSWLRPWHRRSRDIWPSHHSPSEPDSAERSSGTDRHSTRP